MEPEKATTPPKTTKPWQYAAVLALIVCGTLTAMMILRAVGGPPAEDAEEKRAYATSDDEAKVKQYILNNVRYRDAVTFLAFGPHDATGKLGMTWPRRGDKVTKGEPVPVSAIRIRWTYIKMEHFSRAFDFIYYLHDGNVVGREYNPFGPNWKSQLPHMDRVLDPPGVQHVDDD